MKPLKLYLWEGVLKDYTCGVMFALAPDVATARKLISKRVGYSQMALNELNEIRPKVIKKPFGFHLHGGS